MPANPASPRKRCFIPDPSTARARSLTKPRPASAQRAGVRPGFRGNGTPFNRDPLDAVEGIFEKVAGAHQGEAQIVPAGGAERGSRDHGHAGFLEQYSLQLFGGEAGILDVDPGVEGALGSMTPETGNPPE